MITTNVFFCFFKRAPLQCAYETILGKTLPYLSLSSLLHFAHNKYLSRSGKNIHLINPKTSNIFSHNYFLQRGHFAKLLQTHSPKILLLFTPVLTYIIQYSCFDIQDYFSSTVCFIFHNMFLYIMFLLWPPGHVHN